MNWTDIVKFLVCYVAGVAGSKISAHFLSDGIISDSSYAISAVFAAMIVILDKIGESK